MLSREKAKSICLKHQSVNITNEVIDEIYDDFESRTCESCKYKYVVSYDCVECRCSDSLLDYLDLDHTPDFCCNKWEKKEF